MNVTTFDHIVLCVTDLQRSINFYREILGMEPREERAGKWSVHFGHNKISLQHAASVPAIARGTVPGSGNFRLLTQESVAQFAIERRDKGIEVLIGPEEREGAAGRLLSVYFHDPDGNLVEVSNVLHRGAPPVP